MQFAVPMNWRESSNHVNDSYFRMIRHVGHGPGMRPVHYGDELSNPGTAICGE